MMRAALYTEWDDLRISGATALLRGQGWETCLENFGTSESIRRTAAQPGAVRILQRALDGVPRRDLIARSAEARGENLISRDQIGRSLTPVVGPSL